MVSALVCTRNRPDSLLRAVRSLLAPADPSFELIIVDQSDSAESGAVLQSFRTDPRLIYLRSSGRGKGVALNEGLRIARGDIVVCTDDDCEAPDGWVLDMARVINGQPTAAIAFCNVTGLEHDRTAGYIPAYHQLSDRLLRSLADARHGLGLGAGMALRREAVLAFGGFDESFGPGAQFGSCDDWDLSVRALVRGWHIYETAQVSILHHGFRTRAEGRAHANRDWFAIGALCSKLIRVGRLGGANLALWMFLVSALWPPIRDVLRFRRPSGLSRILGFIRGFASGVRMPVDRKTLVFEPPPESGP